jgi:integrase/recombinase XerD
VRTRAGGDFASLLAAFIEDLRRRRYSESSLAKARGELPPLFHHLREEGITDPRAVTEAHLAAYARYLERLLMRKGTPLAVSSRSAALNTIRRFFAFLTRRGLLLRDPAAAIQLPRASRLPRGILSESQARRLMVAPFPGTALGRRDRAILELLYGTGIRLGECVRADVVDLDLTAKTLLVRNGKGRKDRVVPVAGRAAAALDVYLTVSRSLLLKHVPDPALFLSRYGTRLGAIGTRVMLKRQAELIGASVSPHVLRHTCATHLLRGGADIRHVQALLGHRSLTTTALYTRVDVCDLRQVLARAHPRERADRATGRKMSRAHGS